MKSKFVEKGIDSFRITDSLKEPAKHKGISVKDLNIQFLSSCICEQINTP